MGFFCGSAGKESACNAGDLGSIPGLGRSPGGGKSYPLQYSGLENSVHGVTKSRTWLSDFHFGSESYWFWFVLCIVTQSCPTLRPHELWPVRLHGDSPGKNTGVGLPFRPSSRESSQARDRTQVSCIGGRLFTIWATSLRAECRLTFTHPSSQDSIQAL